MYSFSVNKRRTNHSNACKHKDKNSKVESVKQKKAIPIKAPSAKECRRKRRQQKIEELEDGLYEQSTQSKDLALQVLEAGEQMGLIPFKEREDTLMKIRRHLLD